MRNVTVIFRTVAGLETGGGHLMRCIALGYALKDKGCHVEFSVNKKAKAQSASDYLPSIKKTTTTCVKQASFLQSNIDKKMFN